MTAFWLTKKAQNLIQQGLGNENQALVRPAARFRSKTPAELDG
ncbi:MAG: hypothetical protein WB542_00945 [Polaromonas sp.]